MKICPRIEPLHDAWYYTMGLYYCQYCNGRILDKEFLRRIIEYNTPVNIKFRKDVIDNELKIALDKTNSLF